jgi:hypothetical protein
MILAQFLNRGILRGKISYSLPLLFAAALLPDLDFLFYPLFQHHTITHSLTLWSIVYLPVFAIFRIRALPYFIATLSHFMIGDVITGNPPLLFGLSNQTFGLIRPWLVTATGDASYGILFQAIIDAVFVAAFALVAFMKRDAPSIFSSKYNLTHTLILGTVIFAIFLGAYRGDVVHTLITQKTILYEAYTIMAASQLAFFVLLTKGVVSSSDGQKHIVDTYAKASTNNGDSRGPRTNPIFNRQRKSRNISDIGGV